MPEGEIGLNKEYQGRLLWELLQNVDDAAVAADPGQAARDGLQPIGAKGLGFKSVLEISESPEIYSGDFRFLFSRKRTLDRLQGILKGGDNTVPYFSDSARMRTRKRLQRPVAKRALDRDPSPVLRRERKRNARQTCGKIGLAIRDLPASVPEIGAD